MAENGLHIPGAGTVLRVSVKAGDSLACAFTPEGALMEIQGDDLAFGSEAGGTLLLAGFVSAVHAGEVTLDFGEFAVAGSDLYASLTADFSTDFAVSAPDGPELSFALAATEPLFISDLLDANISSVPSGRETHYPESAFAGDPFIISVTQLSPDMPEDPVAPHLRLDILL